MRSRRAALLATKSGISSARRSAPCSGSSAASVASARANQADTSAASFFHRLAHARIGHRLVHTGIGLNLSAAERHMSDLEVARRTAFLLSNPLRKTERLVDVRRLRCFSCSALGHQSLRGSNLDVRECLLA